MIIIFLGFSQGERKRGGDMQQRAAGRIRTRAAAKDSPYMGRTLLLGELEAALKQHFLPSKIKASELTTTQSDMFQQ